MYPMEDMMKLMKPHYDKAVKEAREKDTPGVRRGVGLAWGGFNVSEGPTDNATVHLELNADNTITKYDTWQELGQGGDVGSLMVTLEALKPLKLKPEQIKLIQSDTKICPDSGMSAGSRSHYMNGNATIAAANKMLDAMRKPDGTFRTYDEMVKEGLPTKFEGKFANVVTPGLSRLDPNTGMGDPTPAFTYALNMAEVAVDTKTGKTTVTPEIKENQSIAPSIVAQSNPESDSSKIAEPAKPPELANKATPLKTNTDEVLIQKYLVAAEKAYQAGHFTTPSRNNAYKYYQMVLTTKPDNAEARAGLQKIVDRYVQFIEKAKTEGKPNMVKLYLQRAESVLPDDPKLQNIRKELAAQ